MDGERIRNGRAIGDGPSPPNGTRSAAGAPPAETRPAGAPPTDTRADAPPTDPRPAGAPPIVMVLSTGRCGTQWLTQGLRHVHPEIAAEHEPIGPLYRPRRYFRHYEHPEAILAEPEVAAHVETIERMPTTYVETGWPLFSVLPLLAERVPDRLRIIHLTRNPVPTALSHLAHNSFAGSPRHDAYTDLATLGPNDPNVFQPDYAAMWDDLSPYEKCLFWWTEVNMFGLEIPGRLDAIPLLRVQSEQMLAGEREELERLLDFIGLPWREEWLMHAGRTVDRWHHHTDRDVDPLQVHRHPVTVEVAHRLGYDLSGLNLGALLARYRGEPDPGLDRIGRYG
jgi:Sulfotransferase family